LSKFIHNVKPPEVLEILKLGIFRMQHPDHLIFRRFEALQEENIKRLGNQNSEKLEEVNRMRARFKEYKSVNAGRWNVFGHRCMQYEGWIITGYYKLETGEDMMSIPPFRTYDLQVRSILSLPLCS